MYYISFIQTCNNCNKTDGIPHSYMIDKFKGNDKIITELNVLKEIIDLQYELGIQCNYCKATNWKITEINVDSKLLNDDKKVFFVQHHSGVIKYDIYEIFNILSNSLHRINLSFDRNDLVSRAYMVNFILVTQLLRKFYEFPLIDNGELFNFFLSMYNKYCNIGFTKQEYNTIEMVLSQWESSIVAERFDGVIIKKYPDYEKLLIQVYGKNDSDFLTYDIYKKFMSRYFWTRQFIAHNIDRLFPAHLEMNDEFVTRHESIIKFLKS